METDQNLIYQIGLTLVKGIGTITAKQVLEQLGDPENLFKEKAQLLEQIPGITRRIITEIRKPEVLLRAEKEALFIRKNKITPLFISEENYPRRLKDCIDAPVMMYFRGNANLNVAKVVSIVGTRHASSYGKSVTESLVQGLTALHPEILVVSGLAYGIDIAAHKASLKNGLQNIGVLAHGLDRVYPFEHRSIAIDMIAQGGLLTDFMSGTNPDRQNFVKRNRIVAGLADCTLVIESAEKGGALITAMIADSYNRDVFAIPGRTDDSFSKGCNKLIKEKKAALIETAEDIFREMCWLPQAEETTLHNEPVQRNLFVELNPDEQAVFDVLMQSENLHLNAIGIELNMPISKLSVVLFNLEMKGVIRNMPGGMFRVLS